MDIIEWLEYGEKKGFCSKVVCDIHDGTPMTEEEMNEFDEGHDPCIFVIRVYTEGRSDSE